MENESGGQAGYPTSGLFFHWVFYCLIFFLHLKDTEKEKKGKDTDFLHVDFFFCTF